MGSFGRLGSITYALKRVLKRAGLQRVNPHQFRGYVVNKLLKMGWSIHDVAKWIGHSSPQVSFIHYARCNGVKEGATTNTNSNGANSDTQWILRRARQFSIFLDLLSHEMPPTKVRKLEERSLELLHNDEILLTQERKSEDLVSLSGKHSLEASTHADLSDEGDLMTQIVG
jgi:hypothetical protein